MTYRSTARLVALLSVVVPGSSAAVNPPQRVYRAFNDYCTLSGTFRTCASVTVSTVTTDQGTLVTLRIQNRQGTNPFDNSGGWGIGFFEMYTPDDRYIFNDVFSVSYGPVGAVGVAGTYPGNWDANMNQGNSSNFWPQNFGRGIFGCTPPPIDPTGGPYGWDEGSGGRWGGGYVTCPSQGYTGYYEIKIEFDGQFSANDLQVRWSGYGPYAAGGCDTGDHTTCTTVTPEPLTMTLLATGLAGVGGAALRRRKKGNGVVEG